MYSFYDLKDKNIFITGGGAGIGASLVEAFAKQQARVYFVDINMQAATALVEQLKDFKVDFTPCDITNTEALKAVIRQCFQGKSLDVLINNAGKDTRYKVDEINQSIWDDMQAVNLRHVFFASQEASKLMQQGGSIINFTSTSFIKRSPNLACYATAKAAIIGLTRSLARDLGEANIRVNCIMPGWVLTERQKNLWLTPELEKMQMANQCLKAFVEPADIANMALFLSSNISCKISAQTLAVDGGIY